MLADRGKRQRSEANKISFASEMSYQLALEPCFARYSRPDCDPVLKNGRISETYRSIRAQHFDVSICNDS
jgi:hypothetical protein